MSGNTYEAAGRIKIGTQMMHECPLFHYLPLNISFPPPLNYYSTKSTTYVEVNTIYSTRWV